MRNYLKTTLGVAALIGSIAAAIAIGSSLLPRPMSNEQVIKQTKLCEQAGMKPERIQNGFTYETVHIQCAPKEES